MRETVRAIGGMTEPGEAERLWATPGAQQLVCALEVREKIAADVCDLGRAALLQESHHGVGPVRRTCEWRIHRMHRTVRRGEE
jgi:hypothetical protein